MRKITLLMLFLSTLWGYSQVNRYTFSQATGTYTEMTGGTVLGDETNNAQFFVDPAIPEGSTSVPGSASVFTGVGLPIGFNFTFNGYVYDKFAVATDGWISLGTTALGVNTTVVNALFPIGQNSAAVPTILSAKIVALGGNLIARPAGTEGSGEYETVHPGATLSYKTIGVSPNRTLVVQWKDYKKAASGGPKDNFNFQIRLNETTNTVDMVYSIVCNGVESAPTWQVGMRAEATTSASNFTNRSSTTGWSNTVGGTDVNAKVSMTDVLVPSNGLTFSWTPPTCGGANNLVVSNISTTGATLNWGSYSAADSYEYMSSLSATLPLNTVSGKETTNPTGALTNLVSGPTHYVFLRSKCGSEFTPWVLAGTFRTPCPDVTSFYEDFDSFIPFNNSTLADCWNKAGNSLTNYVTGSTSAPLSAPNKYVFAATGVATAPTVAYVIMPSVSNLQAGTHRLKFKGFSNSTAGELHLGYFTDPSDPTTFVSLGFKNLTTTTQATSLEYVFTFAGSAIPSSSIKNLVFRNNGVGVANYSVNIDNVAWEPMPCATCPDVTAITVKGITHNSVKLSWTKGGSETQWQYVYGPSTVQNPNTLIVKEAPSNDFTLNELDATTKYKVWVRSKTTDGVGAWVGPVAFTTICTPGTQFMENFDSAATTQFLPSCWNKVGATGTVGLVAAPSVSAPYALRINGSGAMVSLPPMSNTESATHQLRFKMRSSADNGKLEIGYLTDVNDPATFQSVKTITIASKDVWVESPETLGEDPKSPYLAFRSVGNIYIDDIAWEPIPTCPSVADLALATVTSTTASLTWTGATAWQYAIGENTLANPYSLTPVNVSGTTPEVTIGDLTPLAPATSYKVWMRSKCTGDNFGSWMGPVTFTTTCTSVTTFSQNFDSVVSPFLPACWNKVGSTGDVYTSSTPIPLSLPNGLSIGASSGPAICSLPPVSNAGAGTHRLRFRFKSTGVDAPLEIGFLVNPMDPSSFSPITSVAASQTTTYGPEQIIELGTDATTEVLAFRNLNVGIAVFNIDDVIWEPIPTCADIQNLVSTTVTDTTIGLDWDAGASETKWQYVYSSTATSPTGLTPVEVTTTSAATISGLTPNTAYKIWVRSKCTTFGLGTWLPVSASTVCEGVDSFLENFDATEELPNCWTKLVGSPTAVVPTLLPGATSGARVLKIFGSSPETDKGMVAIRPIDISNAANHVFKFKYRADAIGSVLEVGYITNPAYPNEFVVITEITIDSKTEFKLKTLSLGSSPVSNMLAFRNKGVIAGNIYIDDVSWEPVATTVPACTGVGTAAINSCGTLPTTIEWPAVATGVDGYKLYVGTTSGGTDVVNGFDTLGLKYSLVGEANTTYYYKVVPYNSIGSATGCAVQSYKTSETQCYCKPALPHKEDKGITNVTLAGVSKILDGPNTKTYYDFTETPVNVVRGGLSNMSITFDTSGYTNKVAVYVDLNDNYIFESSENLFTGQSAAPNVNLLDASFTVPVTASLGAHRVRISSLVVNSGTETVVPCPTGGSGVVADFTVNVVGSLGIDAFDAANFSYYPNPVKDMLNLSFNKEISNVSVVNLLGQQVISKSLNANQGKIDMSGLTKGAYLVKVTVGDQSKTIKVIKE